MVFGIVTPSHLSALSLQQALELSNIYLENAYKTTDRNIALVLCHEAEVALSQAKSASKKYPSHPDDIGHQTLREGVATAYIDLGKLMERQGYQGEAQSICKKAEKWGGNARDLGRLARSSGLNGTPQKVQSTSISNEGSPNGVSMQNPPSQQSKQHNIANLPSHIFVDDLPLPTIEFKLPEPDERLNNTRQLVCCLGLLQSSRSTDDVMDPAARKWLQIAEKDADEQERLHVMATEVIRAFKRDEIKDAMAVTEVVCLAPVLNKDLFHDLLREFYSGIDHSGLLNFHQLEGLAQLIQDADPGHLSADDLVKILELVSTRLRNTHKQSSHHMHQLTLAVSHVLDAMADTKVTGLDRKKLHEPLSAYLGELKGSKDPYLVYQASYAYQAVLCVPDNETTWQAAMRRTGKVVQGVSGLVSAVKSLDLVKFFEGLQDIQRGLEGASKVVEVVKSAYEGVATLAQSGQGFVECLQEGLSFERKRDWYSALRGTDTLIRNGELAVFRKLVCEAPCRYDAAFQWGVCQRLGEIAANPMWDTVARRSAIEFLGEIYRDDKIWGQQSSTKQWILNILMQLTSSPTSSLQLHATIAESLLQELESCGDAKKQEMYEVCKKNGPVAYPLKIDPREIASPSLLDRAQNRPDVEGSVRLLRKQRTKERGNAVYIQPQAKANVQAADDTRFPLMEEVQQFLASDRKVFLLLGDSGAGKSTFSRELEFELWQSYKSKTGRIPLLINLSTIEKPEHDMIAKQLRRSEFTESQIREMKHHRKFILICDGYDESQQTRNLYMSNQLNQPGEWDAQMAISCRSEYLGSDYRDRFQPGDRNTRSDSSQLQEAVITPFSLDQVHTYIKQYVSIHQPLWRASDYVEALELIPSLKELVKNPFLMTLSLEVLPRIVDPGQHLSTTRITRVTLYDHFIEQWLERGKKRLGERDLAPQARDEFERLSAEGFAPNGIEYLKRLAVAIYKEQDGHPVVEYSQLSDEGTWKVAFFNQKHKQLLLEASPMTRNGNQHRFIHRSILEYGLARAIFDPQDKKNRVVSTIPGRRKRSSSDPGYDSEDSSNEESPVQEQEPDLNSPLVWRSFVDENSLTQFLEERVQQEPVFKGQLLAYIEHSKRDKKWSKAAANAITILVRAGVHFIGTDLRGIRIRGADLSYGVFDSVQLQGADLRRVNLQGVWFRQTDMSKAHMAGVQFGEMPFLIEDAKATTCAYSPDGELLAVGLFYGNISVFSTSSWEKTLTLIGHREPVRSASYSPQGDHIVSCSCDGTVRIWNAETGACQRVLTDHTDEVNCVAYSPQGDQIASASDDKTVRIWDSATGECLQTLFGHSDMVTSVAYAPSGKQIASGSEDLTVRLWNVDTGDCSRVLSGHSEKVWAIRYSPEGDQVASAGYDNTIRLWDIETGVASRVLTGHSSFVNIVAYSPNGDHIASGSNDGTVRLWDVETGICLRTWTGHRDVVTSIAYSPKDDRIASSSFDRTIRLWDVSVRASSIVSSSHCSGITDVKYSAKLDLIVSSSMDNTARLWDAKTGICRRTLKSDGCWVACIAFSPQGDQVAAGISDNTIQLWNVETGTCHRTLTGHSGNVFSLAYSPRGDLIASTGMDTTVKLWDVTTGDCCGTLEGHTKEVYSVSFSPSGKWIASAGYDCTVRLWDVESLLCRYILIGHAYGTNCVAFSPQGDQFASGGEAGVIRLWDTATGYSRMTLSGQRHWVSCVSYSPKGDLLASGSDDRTVWVWDIALGECRAVIPSFQEPVKGVVWITSSDENYLVTGSEDGSVLKWQIIEEADGYRVHLQWGSTNGTLNTAGASIQDVRGLSRVNRELLKQRGAVGEPEDTLRVASKKVLTMASVVSRLKLKPKGIVPEPTEERVGQQVGEQVESSIEHKGDSKHIE